MCSGHCWARSRSGVGGGDRSGPKARRLSRRLTLSSGHESSTLRGRFTDELSGPAAVIVDTGEHGPPSERPRQAAHSVAASPTGHVLLVTPARPAGFRYQLHETATGRLLRASDRGDGLGIPQGAMFGATSAVFSPDGARFGVSTGDTTEQRVEVRRMDRERDVAYLLVAGILPGWQLPPGGGRHRDSGVGRHNRP